MEDFITTCPICKTEVNMGNPYDWGMGECPECGNGWFWDEQQVYDEDGNSVDWYPVQGWDKYVKE